jgi:hypothetical protein
MTLARGLHDQFDPFVFALPSLPIGALGGPSVMTSKTQIFGSARVRKCERNDARTQAFHRLGNRTNVRFRYDSGLISDAGSATGSGSRGSDRLNWEMLAIWAFVVFFFAALVFAVYVIWAKCDGPGPF